MEDKMQALIKSMAFLMSTTPDTTIGKLLNFCLATKIEKENSGKTPLEFAQELMAKPDLLISWLNEVIESDNDITVDEMMALSDMRLKNPQLFMQKLLEELETLDTEGI